MIRRPPERAVEQADVLPFRPKRRGVRYRRRHPVRKLLLPFVGAVAIVGVPLWTLSWLVTTPRLALADLRVEIVASEGDAPASSRVPEPWVLQTLAPLLGRNILRLALADAQAQLETHPWVQAVRLTKELPDRLHVQVVEHRAVALLHEGETLLYLDADGRVIEPLAPAEGEVDLLLISWLAGHREPSDDDEGAGADDADLRAALAVADELASIQARWSAGLSEVEVLGAHDFRLVTSELPFPLLVRAGTLADRIRRLEALVPQILARYGTVAAVDLRFARRIVIEPHDGSLPDRRRRVFHLKLRSEDRHGQTRDEFRGR